MDRVRRLYRDLRKVPTDDRFRIRVDLLKRAITEDRRAGRQPAIVVGNAGSADGLDWVEATPKQADGSFERVRIGFKDNLPRAMELHDSFGQTTQLGFSAIQANPAVDSSLFRFAAPPGADVVTE